MSCATSPFLVAQWWRRPFCATTTVRLREKGDGARRSITPFPNGALMAQWHTRRARKRFPEVRRRKRRSTAGESAIIVGDLESE